MKPDAPAPEPTGTFDPDGRLRRAPVQVRPSERGGRGVFAMKPIRSGALIEECPIVVIAAHVPELDDYAVRWDDHGENGAHDDGTLALALGYGAVYNHSDEPNAYWETERSRSLLIVWAARDIAADEEIVISYGPKWFPERGLVPRP